MKLAVNAAIVCVSCAQVSALQKLPKCLRARVGIRQYRQTCTLIALAVLANPPMLHNDMSPESSGILPRVIWFIKPLLGVVS